MPTWTGNTNADYLTGTNWDGNVAPAAGDAVFIDNGGLANQPTLGAGDASTVDTVSLTAGTLTVDGNLSSTSGVTVSSSGVLQVGIAGSISGDVDIGGAGSFTLNGSLTGNFTGTGGTFSIRSTASMDGTITLSGGQVNVSTFGSPIDLSDLTVNGGTFNVDNASVSLDSLSGVGGTVSLTSVGGASSLSFGSDNTNTSYDGDIIMDTQSTDLTKVGLGTTTMSGAILGNGVLTVDDGALVLSGMNSYTGSTFITGGTVTLTGAGSIANSQGVSFDTGSVLDISGTTAGATFKDLFASFGNSGTVEMGSKSLTISGANGNLGFLTFNSDAAANALSVTMDAALEDFSLAGLTFNGWTNGVDTITINGNALGNVITGNSFTNIMSGGGGGDTISGRDGDVVSGGTGNDTIINTFVNGGIWDGGADNDTLDVADDTFDGFTFDLSAASFSIFAAVFSNFENVIASQGDDILVGSSIGNRLDGSGGDDLISGGLGADVIDGGGDNDTADYRTSTGSNVSINLLADTASGGHAAGDTLDNIENLYGSLTRRDILIGNTDNNILKGFGGVDSLQGGDGDDVIEGGADADAINGGAGTGDTASYRDSNTGTVSINLLTNVHSGGDAQGDTLFFMENLEGSVTRRDILVGNNITNVIVGNGGADSIRGEGGNDTIDGGAGADGLNGNAGIDTVTYENSSAGVTVNLNVSTQVSGGDANGDVLFFFENLTGSAHADSLTGNFASNRIVGGAGTDTLNGGTGSDVLTGGADADTFRFSDSGFGTDQILDWQDGIDKISVALPLETSFAGLVIVNNGTTSVTVKGFNGGGAIIVTSSEVFRLDAGDFVFV